MEGENEYLSLVDSSSADELREGVPAYLPDAVLVLFREEEAKSYRTAGSGTSAWGDTLSTYAE